MTTNLFALTRRSMDMDAPARLPGFFAMSANGACLKRLGPLQGRRIQGKSGAMPELLSAY